MKLPGIFSQRDARYSGILLGYNTDPYYNIYHFGCAVVAAANILWWVTDDANWTPARVNQWLKDNGGFQKGGGLIIWGVLAKLLAQYGIVYHGYSVNLNGVNNFLSPENNFAIAQLKGPGFPMHFSAMPYVGRIADSWNAQIKSVPPAYTFVGAHMYTWNKPQPAPAVAVPVTSPAPVQAIIPAAPEPVVPSVTTPIVEPDTELDTIIATIDAAIPAPQVEPTVAQPVAVTVTPAPAPAVAPERTVPIESLKARWVEVVNPVGAFVYDVAAGKAIRRIPFGQKFLIKFFAKDSAGKIYLLTEKMAEELQTEGITSESIALVATPVLDTLTAAAAATVHEVPKLEDLGPAARFVAKIIHLVFGDWSVLKKKDKE